jgi:glycosyltransferase involved in cell wall biosynthesis
MRKASPEVTVSVVVPVYRGKPTLEELTKRLDAALSRCATKHEILFVDDCSPDGSWETIVSLCEKNPRVRGFRLMRNSGQHSALLAGIRAARHSIIVTMDDDLQHPPEEVPALISRLTAEIDLVYGMPKKKQHALWRGLGSWLIHYLVCKISGNKSLRQMSAFRAFRASLRTAFESQRAGAVNLDVLLAWGTTRIAAAAVDHHERKVGKSNYSLLKLIVQGLTMLTGHSTFPLRFASVLGFAATLFGMGVLVYVIGRYLLLGTSVAGFPFLASTIAVFSGVQLFALGIIGEYLGQVYIQTLNRPSYVVSETYELAAEAEASEAPSKRQASAR